MRLRYIVVGLLALTMIAAGVAFSVLKPPAEASQPIEAIPLAIETQATAAPAIAEVATMETVVEPAVVEPAEAVATATTETAAEPAVEAVATEVIVEPTVAAAESEVETAGSLQLYEISQDSSQVRFELDEDLRGVRTTVVGTTDQVAGQIAFDPADLATLQVGVIQVNARTLATDNDMRNRAIQNRILNTGSYEYITFTPTAVEGLPESVAVGETVSFTIVGDLTIRDVSQQVTFEVTATMVSATELQGTAGTTIERGDYNLNIPSVPQVANVEEVVSLVIEFVARPD